MRSKRGANWARHTRADLDDLCLGLKMTVAGTGIFAPAWVVPKLILCRRLTYYKGELLDEITGRVWEGKRPCDIPLKKLDVGRNLFKGSDAGEGQKVQRR